jgi:hypothetical protein
LKSIGIIIIGAMLFLASLVPYTHRLAPDVLQTRVPKIAFELYHEAVQFRLVSSYGLFARYDDDEKYKRFLIINTR